MNKLIYDALSVIFDNSLAVDVKEFLSMIMDGLIQLFTSSNVSQYITIFSAIGASLMIIFFFINLSDMASKDMITLERLVLAFIKLLLGFCIMIFLPEIIQGLFTIIRYIYEMAARLQIDSSSLGLKSFFGESEFPKAYNKETMNFIKGGAANSVLNNLGIMFFSIIVWVGGWAARFAAYFLAVSNAILLIGRAIFSPIAVAQCFEEGQRSNAIMYLKKFAADGLILAIITGFLYAGGLLTANMSSAILSNANIDELTVVTSMEILGNFKLLASILVINFASIGAIMKGNQIAKDVVGVH